MCAEDYSLDYHKLENRLESFSDWNGVLEPFELAIAGFYFTGVQDVCVCFYCGIEIFEWSPKDEPLSEHLKFSPSCNFAIIKKKFEEKIEQEIANSFLRINPPNYKKKIYEEWNFFPIITVSLIVSILFNVYTNFVNSYINK